MSVRSALTHAISSACVGFAPAWGQSAAATAGTAVRVAVVIVLSWK